MAQSPADLVVAANAAGWYAQCRAGKKSADPDGAPQGKDLFSSNCQKCHGVTGRGDGPNGDPQHQPADLTASTTPDGIMFYKIWNGRRAPVMPSFKSVMTKEEIWTVIEYAKSLRASSSQ